MRYQQVVYRKIENEPLLPGDIWASEDPNRASEQGTGSIASPLNIQMSPVGKNRWGKNPKENDPSTNLGNGAYYRPTGLKEMELQYVAVEVPEQREGGKRV